MQENKIIPDFIKVIIRNIIEELNVKQNVLASDAGLSPSTLSEFLKKPEKGMRNNNYKDLILTLEEKYKSTIESKKAEKLKRLFYCLENRIDEQNLKNPKEVIPISSPVYIHRSADNKLDKAMDSKTALMMVLIGGPLMGKSSCIRRLIDIQKNKFEIIQLDFQSLYLSHEKLQSSISVEDFMSFVWSKIKLNVECSLKNEYPTPSDSSELYNNTQILIEKIDKDVLLIFDHLDRLYEDVFVNDNKNADQFLHYLAKLRTLLSRPKAGRTKILISLNTRSYSAKASDLIRTQAKSIVVDDLKESQVIELAKLYGIDSNLATKINRYYAGQPYLCHNAVWSISAGNTWKDIQDTPSETEQYWAIINKTDRVLLQRFDSTIKDIYPKLLSNIHGIDYRIIDILNNATGILHRNKIKSPYILKELENMCEVL